MGQNKRELARLEGLREAATEILLETGAVRTHRRDEATLINELDEDAVKHAYAIGTNRVKAGEVDGTREEMIEAISEVMADSQI